MKIGYFVFIGLISWLPIQSLKVLYQASSLEDIPLSQNDLENDGLVIKFDLVRNRVLLLQQEEDDLDMIPEINPYQGTGRKPLLFPYSGAVTISVVNEEETSPEPTLSPTNTVPYSLSSTASSTSSTLEYSIIEDESAEFVIISFDQQGTDTKEEEDRTDTEEEFAMPSLFRVQPTSTAVDNSFEERGAFVGSLPQPSPSDDDTFETVIGVDGRVRVKDTEEYPYRAIGRVTARCKTSADYAESYESFACTGAMIGPNKILTAAHCLFKHKGTNGEDLEKGDRACKSIKFAPAQQGTFKPFGEVIVQDIQIPTPFMVKTNQEFDYAMMTLAEDIGYEVGWMGYGYRCLKTTQDLVTAGYPSDKDPKSQTMYKAECFDQTINACPCKDPQDLACRRKNSFKYDCDTFAGQSGSPVWSTMENGLPQIRAIHSRGFNPTSSVQQNTAIFLGPNNWEFFKDLQ